MKRPRVRTLGCEVPPRPINQELAARLTNGELAVVQGILGGLSNREIAEHLGMAETTVKKHLFRVLDKTGASTRIDLMLRLYYPERISSTAAQPEQEPPRSAKFLLILLLSKSNREHLLGDLEEEYRTVLLPEYGPAKARFWYWWQALSSLAPLLWAQLKQAVGLALLLRRVRR
jgi:DNA-binding CsgD family transcriptional regulator